MTCTLIALFIATGCSVKDQNTKKHMALRLPPTATNAVQSITTINDGLFNEIASSSEETIAHCEEFKITDEQAKKFFSSAIMVRREEYIHAYLPSRCYAEGTLQSMGNESGYWKIDRARRGLIKYDTQDSIYFFCNDCEEEVFYEACDLDCALGISY